MPVSPSRLARKDLTGRGTFISRKFFDDLEDWLRDNQASQVKFQQGMNLLVNGLALYVKGEAQKRSGGPVAPRRRSNPALAYKIPVQRITGQYFAGWMLRRLGPGRYLVYNDAVEAFLIETGLYQRVRRPILKMSVLSMLKFFEYTRTGDRFVDWAMAPRKRGRAAFSAVIAAGGMSGPEGSLP